MLTKNTETVSYSSYLKQKGDSDKTIKKAIALWVASGVGLVLSIISFILVLGTGFSALSNPETLPAFGVSLVLLVTLVCVTLKVYSSMQTLENKAREIEENLLVPFTGELAKAGVSDFHAEFLAGQVRTCGSYLSSETYSLADGTQHLSVTFNPEDESVTVVVTEV